MSSVTNFMQNFKNILRWQQFKNPLSHFNPEKHNYKKIFFKNKNKNCLEMLKLVFYISVIDPPLYYKL